MVQRITIAPQGPEFSRFVMGYWRLMDWNMSARQLVSFIEEHLDLGVTTVDHADIYGGYQCEAAFGEALKLAPHLRERMEIVSKCGIATTAREENVIGHYITDRDHIRWKYPRCISRYCWMARSTNYNNCVFVRWRGPALVVVVCLMMIISSRCVMNWLWWQRS